MGNHAAEGSIQAAILQHQKDCLEGIKGTVDTIWKSVRKISEHQDRLTNDEETGKVDVLWLERQQKIGEERERRRYWTRWIIVTTAGFLLANFGIFAWFLHKIELVIKAAKLVAP